MDRFQSSRQLEHFSCLMMPHVYKWNVDIYLLNVHYLRTWNIKNLKFNATAVFRNIERMTMKLKKWDSWRFDKSLINVSYCLSSQIYTCVIYIIKQCPVINSEIGKIWQQKHSVNVLWCAFKHSIFPTYPFFVPCWRC